MMTGQRARELDEELDAYLKEAIARRVASGATPDEARRLALAELGSRQAIREDVADVGWRGRIASVVQDIRFACRRLRRHAGFTALAVAVLGFGIGVNVALYSVVKALFIRDLGVPNQERLVFVAAQMGWEQIGAMDPSWNEFVLPPLRELGTVSARWNIRVPLTVGDEMADAAGEMVTLGYFDVLGTSAFSGRLLDARDYDPASPELSAVVSYKTWVRRFGSSPDAVGSQATIRGRRVTIVGIAPPGVVGISTPWEPTQLWMSDVHAAQILGLPSGPAVSVGPIVRLKPGATLQQCQAALDAAIPRIRDRAFTLRQSGKMSAAAGNALDDASRQWHLFAYRAMDVTDPIRPAQPAVPRAVVIALVAVTGLVLLIAVTNISGLLLVRGLRRTGETAVRRALGASAGRLTREFLIDSLLLTLLGGATGLVLASWFIKAFSWSAAPRFDDVDVHLAYPAFLAAAGVCGLVGAVLGLGPALQALRVNVQQALGSGVIGSRGSGQRIRRWLVVPQLAISLALLVVAGAHVRGLQRVDLSGLGYSTSGGFVMHVNRWAPRQPPAMSPEERRRTQEEGAERARAYSRALVSGLKAIPGIHAGVIANGLLPFSPSLGEPSPVIVDGRDEPTGARAIQTIVSDDYFAAMGIRVLRGRVFDDRDRLWGTPTAVISRSLAAQLLPNADPGGHRIAFAPTQGRPVQWLDIIGIVDDARPVLKATEPRPDIYVSMTQQWRADASYVIVRGPGDPAAIIGAAKRAVAGADSMAEVSSVRSVDQIVADILRPRRVAATVLLAAGLVGLVQALIGLYAVIAFSIRQRARELGIRTALGADATDIARLVLRETAIEIAAGCALGLALTWPAFRLSRWVLPDVPLDIPSVVMVPILLACVVIAACAIPARRAARLDPAGALRE